MARLARIVIPGLPHHLTQRGHRRAQIFFTDDDYVTYLAHVQADAARRGMAVLADCCMPNHTHLVGVPATATAVAETLRDAHTAYAVYRNRAEGALLEYGAAAAEFPNRKSTQNRIKNVTGYYACYAYRALP